VALRDHDALRAEHLPGSVFLGSLAGVRDPAKYRPHLDQGIRLAKRVAKEYVFVAPGGGNDAFSLAPPIGKFRDDDRAGRSPSQDSTPVFSFRLLDQDLV
jgi:hypothetical protein